MNDRLKQIIALSKKTGDRIVVFDNSAPEDSFVLMGIDEYTDLTEKKIDDRMPERPKKTADLSRENIYSSADVIKDRIKTNGWQIPEKIKEAADKED